MEAALKKSLQKIYLTFQLPARFIATYYQSLGTSTTLCYTRDLNPIFQKQSERRRQPRPAAKRLLHLCDLHIYLSHSITLKTHLSPCLHIPRHRTLCQPPTYSACNNSVQTVIYLRSTHKPTFKPPQPQHPCRITLQITYTQFITEINPTTTHLTTQTSR